MLARSFPAARTCCASIVAPLIADRDYRLECRFTYRTGDEGVMFALGDVMAGMALFVRDATLTFVYHGGHGQQVVSTLRVSEGANRFELVHRALGGRRGEGALRINDQPIATTDMSPTTILGLGVGEGLDVGIDRKLHVTDLYRATVRFRTRDASHTFGSSRARIHPTVTRTGWNARRNATRAN